MARKAKDKKVSLLRTVNHGGTYYPPGEVLVLPADIAEELIDGEAAEPVLAVAVVEERELLDTDD